MNLKEICAQLSFCNFECEGGHIQSNTAFIELGKMAEQEEDSCIYDGPANMDAMNTVRCGISCYDGKRIRVSITEVRS